MHRVRRRSGEAYPAPDSETGRGLPVRWAVITVAAIQAALVVYQLAGPVPAITVGLTVAGTLHKILA
jgi:hypothetical protein